MKSSSVFMQGQWPHQSSFSLYISSSEIQGNTSDHYLNSVDFLMKRSEIRSSSPSDHPNLTKQYKYTRYEHRQTPTISYLKLWTFGLLFFSLDMEFLGLLVSWGSFDGEFGCAVFIVELTNPKNLDWNLKKNWNSEFGICKLKFKIWNLGLEIKKLIFGIWN